MLFYYLEEGDSMKEIWKDIPGYEGLYQASNLGRIKSLDKVVFQKAKNNSVSKHIYKGKILKPILHDNGYNYVTLNYKIISVHKLIAKTYLQNNEKLPQINHKDGNKTNNNINNLEYCSASYNMKHAYKNNLINMYSERRKRSNNINIMKANIHNYKKIINNSTNQEHINVTKLKLRLLEAQLNREYGSSGKGDL